MGHKRNPTMPPSSHHHRSSTSASPRKQGRKRSESFSDFIHPDFIARASNSGDLPAAAPAPVPKPKNAGIRKASIRSVPHLPPPYVDDKKWWSPTDPLLPTLSAVPPPLPSKEYPVSGGQQQQQQQSSVTWTPHVAMRFTARVFGRTLEAIKGGQRSREGR